MWNLDKPESFCDFLQSIEHNARIMSEIGHGRFLSRLPLIVY